MKILLTLTAFYFSYGLCLGLVLNKVPPARNGLMMMSEKGAWLPIGSVKALDSEFPSQIEIVGEKLAVWKDPTKESSDEDCWSAMIDICPHRLAPLSEGRVDESGCIECPYHGWSFETDGKLRNIPQMEPGRQIPKAKAEALKTKVTGEMLWAFMPLADEEAALIPNGDKSPDEIYPEITDLKGWCTRSFPYSWDFLVENFMDPSHIPFAHHSLQAKRSDGSAIPITKLTSVDNSTHCEFRFEDVIRSKDRTGISSFITPCFYHFRTPDKLTNAEAKLEEEGGKWNKGLHILCVPVRPGKSTVHISIGLRTSKDGKKVDSIPSWVPTWIKHGLSNNFVDSDIWVHDQEIAARTGTQKRGYITPTSSDIGPVFFRQWWKRKFGTSKFFGPANADDLKYQSKEEILDRYEHHTKNCAQCRKALERALVVKERLPWILAFLLVVVNPIPKPLFVILCRSLTLAGGFVVNIVCNTVVRLTTGPERGERTSAAQFPA